MWMSVPWHVEEAGFYFPRTPCGTSIPLWQYPLPVSPPREHRKNRKGNMFLPWKAIQVNFGQNLWTPCLWPRFCCWRFVWRFMKCSIFDWKPSKLSNFNQSKRTCHCKGTTGPSFNSSHHNIGMIRAKIRSCAHAIVVHKLSHSSPPLMMIQATGGGARSCAPFEACTFTWTNQKWSRKWPTGSHYESHR